MFERKIREKKMGDKGDGLGVRLGWENGTCEAKFRWFRREKKNPADPEHCSHSPTSRLRETSPVVENKLETAIDAYLNNWQRDLSRIREDDVSGRE